MQATRRSRQWWQARVAALEASGLSHRDFAEQHGLELASLRHWLYAERRSRRQEPMPALVEVQWSPDVAPAVVTATVGRIELRAPVGVDPAWFCALLAGLAGTVSPC